MLRHAIGAAALALAVASADPAAAQRDTSRRADLRRLGRHRLHHRLAEGGHLHVRAEPPGPQQVYSGSISKFGLDIGATGGGVMVWAVFTDSLAPPGPGFLAGDYFGASGEVTVAAGLGANVLVGGSNHTSRCSRSRCPASVGLNLAARRGGTASAPRPLTAANSARCMNGRRRGGRFRRPATRAGPSEFRRRAPDAGASCQVPLRPETMAQTVSQKAASRCDWEADMAQNGTRATGPRCIALVGPFQSGKTTLLEAILARTGAIQRQGTVDAGNTVGDASKEARHHKMSVELSVATTNFMGDTYTFVDCPGSVEFVHDMRAALPAVDAAVVVCELDEKKVPQLQLILRELEDAENSALPVPQQDRQGRCHHPRRAQGPAAGLAQQAAAAPDTDLCRRHRHRLRRSRARARVRLQGACAVGGRSARRRCTRPREDGALLHAGDAGRP